MCHQVPRLGGRGSVRLRPALPDRLVLAGARQATPPIPEGPSRRWFTVAVSLDSRSILRERSGTQLKVGAFGRGGFATAGAAARQGIGGPGDTRRVCGWCRGARELM